MIRKCLQSDRERIYFIINEAAKAYEGVIPIDCYHQPYMDWDELKREIPSDDQENSKEFTKLIDHLKHVYEVISQYYDDLFQRISSELSDIDYK